MAKKKKAQRKVIEKPKKRILRTLSRNEKAKLKNSRRPRKKVQGKKPRRFKLRKYKADQIGSAFDQEKKIYSTSFKPYWVDREELADIMIQRTLKLKNQIGRIRPTIWGLYWIYQCRIIDEKMEFTDEQGSTNIFMRKFDEALGQVTKRFLNTTNTNGSKSAEWFAPIEIKIYAQYNRKPKTTKKSAKF